MKKLSLLIILSILAVGIAANANIRHSDNIGIDVDSKTIQHAATAEPQDRPDPMTNPATVSILLGVGFVGLVTFTRRG